MVEAKKNKKMMMQKSSRQDTSPASDHNNMRKTQVVESLLAKPSGKPNFSAFGMSDALKRAQEFLPIFVQSTDRLLNDPVERQAHQMQVRISEMDDFVPNKTGEELLGGPSNSIINPEVNGNQDQNTNNEVMTVNMEIGVGLFDVQGEQKAENAKQRVLDQFTQHFRQGFITNSNSAAAQNQDEQIPAGLNFGTMSTEPILRITRNQTKSDDSDSSDSSDDEDAEKRFIEFPSSDDEEQEANNQMVDSESLTTKSSMKITSNIAHKHKCMHSVASVGAQQNLDTPNFQGKQPPLIQEISSIEFSEEMQQDSADKQVSSAAGLGKRTHKQRH